MVVVRLHQPKARTVRWAVIDNGPGMNEEVIEKLFTPYYTTKRAGTGLGLAITQRHIVEHGGRISVTSGVERGTRFEVALPWSNGLEDEG